MATDRMPKEAKPCHGRCFRLILLLSIACSGNGHVQRSWVQRRMLAVLPLAIGSPSAMAFENRIFLAKGPKTPGPQPAGVGKGQIQECGVAPNCFSSTSSDEHYLKPWSYPSGGKAQAMADLEKVIKLYPPGQQDVDGGGFQIQNLDEKGYVYVQFESLKRGYIDDVEFLVKPTNGDSGEVLVRSASRLGYLDLGVNAKRLNWLSQKLRDLGWTAPKITAELFPRYVSENR
ncbi:unnamed protein product [Cladocopium goreaui]|uniref:DUF1499 domain-containing protein n=1 Tax=Cladocopium goreaui TaxID=2562237 RepID=A0A9P1GAR0_9DINO|nr:unnamed protein product [Cladocopium goreaui]